MANFLDLPDEIVVHIFTFLRFRDRKMTRQVCKWWHRLSYTLALIKKDITVIHDFQNLNEKVSPDACFVNIELILGIDNRIPDPSLGQSALKFWTNHGGDVKSLDLNCTFYYLQFFPAIMENCANLEHLSLTTDIKPPPDYPRQAFGTIDTTKFPELKTLKIWGEPIHALRIIEAVLEKPSRLEMVRVPKVGNIAHFANATMLKLFSVAELLSDVDISFCEIDVKFFDKMTEILGSRIKNLALQWYRTLSDSFLKYITDRCITLQQLSIKHCKVGEPALTNAFFNLQHISVISLSGSGSRCITDIVVSCLDAVPNLTHLDLTGCGPFGDIGVLCVFAKVRPKMEELRLGFTAVTDYCITGITPNLPNLKILNLTCCISLTNKSLEAITKHTVFLQCLSINGCINIKHLHKQPGFSVNHLKRLVHLGLNEHMLKFLYCLRLPSLQVIDGVSFNMDLELGTRFPSLIYIGKCNIKKPGLPYPSECYVVKRRTGFLKCYKSPFGACNNFNPVIELRSSLPYYYVAYNYI